MRYVGQSPWQDVIDPVDPQDAATRAWVEGAIAAGGGTGGGVTPDISAAVTGLPAGTPPTVTRTGPDATPLLTFGLPEGDQGDPGPVPNISAAATGLAAGAEPTVTRSGPDTAPLFTFGIPEGAAGAGTAAVRASATFTTSGGVAGTQYTGTIAMASGYRLLSVRTSAAARVRLYTDAAAQTADMARAVTTVEPDNSGLVLDYLTVDGTVQRIAPSFAGYSMEAVPSANIPITVTPTGAATITVTIVYVGLE